MEEHALVVRYSDDGGVHFHNAYVNYFPYALTMVEMYLDLIRAGDVEGLASFLNADDLEVPEWVAKETVRKFEETFDLEDAKVRYLNGFRFAVVDGGGKEHPVEVIYGDWLMGIRDEFIPEFQ